MADMTIVGFYEMAQRKLEGQFTDYTLDIQYSMGDPHFSIVFRVGEYQLGTRVSFEALKFSDFPFLEETIDNMIAEILG